MTGLPKKPQIFFPDLDGLRFLAFLAVFLQHAFLDTVRSATGGNPGLLASLALHVGGQGVALFFVLSGFLITYLLLVERDQTGTIDVRAFYVRRVLRIWPLYFVSLLLAFGAYPVWKAWSANASIETPRLFPYLVFLGNFEVMNQWVRGWAVPHLDVTWSISIEEQFYLVWPILLRFTPRRVLPLMFPAVVLGSFIFRVATRTHQFWGEFHSVSVVSDFAVGGWLAYLMLYRTKSLSSVIGAGRVPIGCMYLLGLIALLLRDLVFLETIWPGVPRALQAFLVLGRRVAFSLFYAWIIAEQCLAEHSVIKLRAFPTITALGTYSFGLYLLHPYAIIVLHEGALFLALDNTLVNRLLLGIGALPLSIGLALVCHRVIERPFLNLKRRFQVVQSGS